MLDSQTDAPRILCSCFQKPSPADDEVATGGGYVNRTDIAVSFSGGRRQLSERAGPAGKLDAQGQAVTGAGCARHLR